MLKNKLFSYVFFHKRYGHLRMEPEILSDFETSPSKVNDSLNKTANEVSSKINPSTCSLHSRPVEVSQECVSHLEENGTCVMSQSHEREADHVMDQMDKIHDEALQCISRSTSGASKEKQLRQEGLSVEEHEIHIRKQKSFFSRLSTSPEETSVFSVQHISSNSMEGKGQTQETLEPSAAGQKRKTEEYMSRKLKACPSDESIRQYPIDVKVVVIEHGECSLEENETNVETTQLKEACTSQQKLCLSKESSIREEDPRQSTTTKLEAIDDRKEESDVTVSKIVSDIDCDGEEHPTHSELCFTDSSNYDSWGCEGLEIPKRQHNLFSGQEKKNLGNNTYSDFYLRWYDFTYGCLDMDPEPRPSYNWDDIEVSTSDDDLGCWEPVEQPSENRTLSDTCVNPDHAGEIIYSRISGDDIPDSPPSCNSDDTEVSTSDADLGYRKPVEQPSETSTVSHIDVNPNHADELLYSRISGGDKSRRNLAYALLRDQRVIEALPPRVCNILHEIAGTDERSPENAFPLHSFDAFISYTRQDQSWVMRELVQKLEYDHEPKIRLCLHQRYYPLHR